MIVFKKEMGGGNHLIQAYLSFMQQKSPMQSRGY